VLRTIRFVSSLPVWGVKFHQLQVVRGTPLEEMYKRGGIKALNLEDYASVVVDCLELLPDEVVVHRLSGDTPGELLVAPRWGVNKFVVTDGIERLLRQRHTYQGAKCLHTAID
jgi:radical SAM superfamily enzyme